MHSGALGSFRLARQKRAINSAIATSSRHEDDHRPTADADLGLIGKRRFTASFADIVGRRQRRVSQQMPFSSSGGCGGGRVP